MNRSQMAHDLAVAFAASQQTVNTEIPQNQIEKLLEDYCSAYGFFESRTDEFLKELVHRGELFP